MPIVCTSTINGLIFNDKATIQCLSVVGKSTVLAIETVLLRSSICTNHSKGTASSTTVGSSSISTSS